MIDVKKCSVADLVQFLEDLDLESPRNVSTLAFDKLVARAMCIVDHARPLVLKGWDTDFHFWRGRIDNGEDFSSAKALGPPDCPRDYGRCNPPGRSIFYAAMNLETVLAELRPPVQSDVRLSHYRLPKNSEFRLGFFGQIALYRMSREVSIDSAEKKVHQFAKKVFDLTAEGDEWSLKRTIIDAFLSEIFARSTGRVPPSGVGAVGK